jgi:thiosulfate/3-mercaptopyruvate sulfurtransferase
MVSPLIQTNELLALYQNGISHPVLIDASAGPDALANYKKQHLQGAIFVDLETQLAELGDNAANGGRHPLPTLTALSQTLAQLGITPETHVVVYDDKQGSNAAARFWWMLTAIGHPHIYVLDGGLQSAQKAGFPISKDLHLPDSAAPYPISEWILPQASLADVQQASKTGTSIIIDVRDADRYAGLREPIDLIAGHIPQAINIPFTHNLKADGTFKDKEDLGALYAPILQTADADSVIVHCGSGVTACHTLLAIAVAGFPIPALYVGSWSEWSRHQLPMITHNLNA